MTVVDRSQDPILHLEYGIPFEDTAAGPDEVEDSRTHQFFAFCRDHHLDQVLPRWVTQADLDAAAAKELGDPATIESEDILELSQGWQGCWHRVNADEDRRPITFAAAEEGVDWDTSAVSAGSYELEGFTHEPWFNRYWPRPGVVKVVDSADPELSAPAAAITTGEQILFADEGTMIEGCASAALGTTLQVFWLPSGDPQAPLMPLGPATTLEGENFSFWFEPPPEAIGNTIYLALELEDPQGRSYLAYMDAGITVLSGNSDGGGSEEGGCQDGGDFIGGCDGGDSSGDGDSGETGADDGATASTGASTSDDGVPPSSGNCACRAGEGDPIRPELWALGALLVGGIRRRARSG